jgi:choice-of-anchor B domain-containing protein
MRQSFPALIAAIALLSAATPSAAQTFRSAEAAEAGFGAAVAVGDGEVFVAEAANRFRAGIVYVYRKAANGAWTERAQLTSSTSALRDQFGQAIAVDGSTLMVASQSRDSGSAGMVHVFTRGAGGTWSETGMIHAPEGAAEDHFGASLILHGDDLMVGAPGHGDGAGAIFRFHRTGNAWQPSGTLVAAAGKPGDRLGSSMTLSGPHLMAGIPATDSARGGVVHFHNTGSAWVQGPVPTVEGLAPGSRFGSAVALRGNRIWIGAPGGRGAGGGAVYGFTATPEGPVADAPLTRFDGVSNTGFGASLAATDEGLWIGAPGSRGAGGQVHLYHFGDAEGSWAGVEVITPGEMVADQGFGSAMAIAGDLAVIGIPWNARGSGNAIVMQRSAEGWSGSVVLASLPDALASITGDQVRCDEGFAAKFGCDAVDLVSFLPVNEIGADRGIGLNDIWGWTDPTNKREYAIIGRNDGTSFVDLTDAAHPRYVGDLPMTPGSRVAVWRDMKVYRDHVYIVADGAGDHGVQVFDLDHLRGVTTPQTFSADYLYTNVASAHNIVINEESGFGYVVGASGGGETCGGGLHMLDLHQPKAPQFVGCHADGVTGRRGTGYSHDAQCLMYRGPDADYTGHEICVGANETALSLADVTDKANTKVISTISYPKVAYTHQGWFSEDQRFFFSNDEGDEGKGDPTRTLVWDMSDLDDPVLIKEYFATTMDTDHNLYVRGNFMYQSNYGAGLRIIDVSNPAEPKEVGFFNTNSQGGGASWSNYPYFPSGVIAVTGGSTGIFFLKKREQLVP